MDFESKTKRSDDNSCGPPTLFVNTPFVNIPNIFNDFHGGGVSDFQWYLQTGCLQTGWADNMNNENQRFGQPSRRHACKVPCDEVLNFIVGHLSA